MKLYDWPFAPNPRRVRMFLAEKGLGVTVEEVGGPNVTLKPESVARFDPHATAPTLELDDGTCISESMAICRYFEELHPEPRLMGRDAKDKAIVEMWERRAYEGAMLAIGELLRNTNPAFVDRGRGRHARFTKSADKQLAHNRFLAGAAFSVADVTAYYALEFLNRAVKMPIPDALGNLRRGFDEFSACPSAAATA
jgi:glutathione S-transferase